MELENYAKVKEDINILGKSTWSVQCGKTKIIVHCEMDYDVPRLVKEHIMPKDPSWNGEKQAILEAAVINNPQLREY